MSVRNAGASIREAREKAGLSREKLADGICSPTTVKRIENGSAGVSPSTFQALMAYAGAPCEVFPIFANRRDFDCFYALKHVRFYLDSWQLQPAYEELNKIEEMEWSDNRFYYQEWLLLHCKLQFRSGLADHQAVHDLLLDALHITRPVLDINDFRSLLLSLNEIELLIFLAQECLYLNQCNDCLQISTQIDTYLNNSEITYLEKDRLLAENVIVSVKYLLSIEDYENAYELADKYRHQMVLNRDDGPLFELTFLTGLSAYYLHNIDAALSFFQNVFYSAHSIESCYATTIRNYITELTTLILPEYLRSLPDIKLVFYALKKAIDTSPFSDGTYDLFSPDVFTIGNMIRCFRTEQNVSQAVLCQGLCSKSKLSKIENGTLQPDIFLAEALLQRLGISEREFTFWGNAMESKLYNLQLKLLHNRGLTIDENRSILNEFYSLIPDDNVILQQYYLYHSDILESSPQKILLDLNKALSCTLPNFEINHIYQYRLSWNELTILNNIAYTYRNTSTPIQGFTYFNKLLEYNTLNHLDIIFQCHIFSLTYFMLSRSLYLQKRYLEINNLFSIESITFLPYRISIYGSFLFYYCQALGECSLNNDAKLFGLYTYGLQSIVERHRNSLALNKYMSEDFKIKLI